MEYAMLNGLKRLLLKKSIFKRKTMIYFSDDELQRYIHDDLPYFDLTTSLQNCTNKLAKLLVTGGIVLYHWIKNRK